VARKRHADPAEAGLLIGVLQKLRSEAGPCWTADFDPFVLMCSPARPARVKVGTWIKKWTVVVDAAQLR
jgi:hypothetical protein